MINILIVEDSVEKCKRLIAAILSIDGCERSRIQTVGDLYSARVVLKTTQFDLLLLDIVLPERLSEQPASEAGMMLLNELSERAGMFKMPFNIIGTTAHAEILSQASARFALDLLPVVPYDNSSTEWEIPLARRIAQIVSAIRAAKSEISNGLRAPTSIASPETLILRGESSTVEFKSSLRFNQRTQVIDLNLEHGVLKAIASFLNSDGGTLLIGVADDGKVVGIPLDGFDTEDKLLLHLTNLVRSKIGVSVAGFINYGFSSIGSARVLRVDCNKAHVPAYLKVQSGMALYIRIGPSSVEVPLEQVHDYIVSRFET